MVLVDNFAEPAPRHVRIHLRGGNVGVSQHDLDAAQVRAALHQMRGKTVPDDVRGQPAENSCMRPCLRIRDQNVPRVIADPRAVTNRNLLARPFSSLGRPVAR